MSWLTVLQVGYGVQPQDHPVIHVQEGKRNGNESYTMKSLVGVERLILNGAAVAAAAAGLPPVCVCVWGSKGYAPSAFFDGFPDRGEQNIQSLCYAIQCLIHPPAA